MEELVCTSCGSMQMLNEAKLSLQPIKDGREHVRVSCKDCGKWIKWASKDSVKDINGIPNFKEDSGDFDFDTPINTRAEPIREPSSKCEFMFETVDSSKDESDNEECPFDL